MTSKCDYEIYQIIILGLISIILYLITLIFDNKILIGMFIIIESIILILIINIAKKTD